MDPAKSKLLDYSAITLQNHCGFIYCGFLSILVSEFDIIVFFDIITLIILHLYKMYTNININ